MKLLMINIFFFFFRWTYADPSWARIAALVPYVVSCAEEGDQVAISILLEAVQELASSVKAVVRRLQLCGEGMVHSVLPFGERIGSICTYPPFGHNYHI